MATIIWTSSGGISNSASTSANWVGSIPPKSSDIARFTGLSVVACSWDLVNTVSSLSVNSSYTGVIQMITNMTLSAGLNLDDGT